MKIGEAIAAAREMVGEEANCAIRLSHWNEGGCVLIPADDDELCLDENHLEWTPAPGELSSDEWEVCADVPSRTPGL